MRRESSDFKFAIIVKDMKESSGKLPDKTSADERDISGEMSSEEVLPEKEAAGRALLNNPIDSVLLIDRQGTVLHMNETAARRINRTVSDIIGLNIYDLLPPELAISRKVFVKKVLKTGEPCRFEDEREGIWYDHVLNPVSDYQGNVVGVSICARDITDRKIARKQLHSLVDQFVLIFENMGDGVTLSDESGHFQLFNRRMEYLTGYTLEEVNNMRDFLAALYPEHAEHERASKAINDILRTGSAHHDETVIRTKGGEKRALSVITSRILIKDKTWLLSVYHDITERKWMEDRLRLGNRVIEASPEHISVIDQNYVYKYINKSYTEAHGLPRENIVGMHVADLLGREVFEERVKALLDRCFKGEEVTYESWFHFRNAGRRFMLVHYLPLKDVNGHIDSLVVFSKDITDIKKIEEGLHNALDESKRREKEILELQRSSHAVLTCRKFEDAARSIFDSCKDIIGARAGYVAMLSRDGHKNQVLFLDPGGLSCSVDPSLPMPIRGLRERAYQTGRTVFHNEFSDSEWMKFLPEGHVRLSNVLFSPLMIEGKTVGLLGLANKPGGFTENDAVMAAAFGELASISLLNSRTLEAVENSEERFRSVVETANDAIITIDRFGKIVSCNKATETIFDYSCGEIIGEKITMLMPERFREFHQNALNRALTNSELNIAGRTLEIVALRKNGSEFPVELSLAKWATVEGVFFTGIIRDVTDHKQSEMTLKKERDRIQKYLEVAEVIFVVIDTGQRVRLINRKGCEILGFKQEEILGRNWFDNFVPLRVRNEIKSVFLKFVSGFVEPVKYFENPVLTAYGEERTIAWNNTVLTDDDGNITGTLGSGTDITHLKRMSGELEKAKGELEVKVFERTEELRSAVGLLQDEIAERKVAEKKIMFFQEQLRLLMSRLSLTEELERKRISAELHDNISQNLAISKMKLEEMIETSPAVAREAKAVHALIAQTIKFVRSMTFELSSPILYELGLVAAVEHLVEKLNDQYNMKIELIPGTISVEPGGDASILLFKVIRELLMNVIKHSQAGKAVVSISGDSRLEIRVEDNGSGFDTSMLDIHTQKSECFGLFNIREKIRYLKGTFEIKSKPGEGTRVKIVVPLYPADLRGDNK